jgi:uncharacterized protein YbcI
MGVDVEIRPAPGGSIAAATSREIVRLYARLLGRGPTRARTHLHTDHVACVLEDVFTRAERTLIDVGRGSQVVEMRLSLHDAMKPQLIRIVEEHTARPVRLCICQFDAEADVALEFFLFEPREVVGGD